MVLEQRLDGEACAQEGRALFVGDRLVPDVHSPFVGRHIEQACLGAVGHGHLVLTAQEPGRRKGGLALGGVVVARRVRVARTVFRDKVRTARLQVDAGGPGDLLDEGKRIDQLAGGGVVHIEKSVAVGFGSHALAVHVEGDEFVDAVIVPGIVGRTLVAPDDLSGLDIDGHGRGGIQVVALAHMAVPGARVAGAEVGQAGLGIVGAAQPRRRAAGLPRFTRPAGVSGAGDAIFLAVEKTHVAFDYGARPDHFAGLGVARLDTAHHAELAARQAGDQEAFGDQRRGSVAVAGAVVVDLLPPDDLAGGLVQGHQLRIERAENHQVVIKRSAPVDHVAAGHDAFGQAVLVLPELGAGLGVQGKDARIRRRDEHLAVVHQRLRLLAALLFPAERHRPDRHQAADGLGVDVGQR